MIRAEKVAFRIVLLCSILAGTVAIATSPDTTRNYSVTSVPTVVVTRFESGQTVVIGSDGIARTCPVDKGVAPYIRVEAKDSPNVFQYVFPGTFIQNRKDRSFTLACLKIQ